MERFRIAEERDAKQIADLHATSWRRTYRGNFRDGFLDGDVSADRSRVWNERLTAPPDNQFVCVAEDESGISGFVCAFGDHDSQWGSFIDNLHVDIDRQGQGVGTRLMARAGQWLSERFLDSGVYLIVWERNPARFFYERLGGRDTGRIEVENPGGGSGRYIRVAWDRPGAIVKWANSASIGCN